MKPSTNKKKPYTDDLNKKLYTIMCVMLSEHQKLNSRKEIIIDLKRKLCEICFNEKCE